MVLPRVHRSYYVLQQCKRVLAKSQMSVRPSVSDVSPVRCPLAKSAKRTSAESLSLSLWRKFFSLSWSLSYKSWSWSLWLKSLSLSWSLNKSPWICHWIYNVQFMRYLLPVAAMRVFAALHGMQTRSSDENSVCLSVKLADCGVPSNVCNATKRKKVLPRFLYHMKERLS